MASNKRQNFKKTHEEAIAYKSFVKNTTECQQDTININNDNLRGSDQIRDDFGISTQEPLVTWNYKLKRFIRRHLFETIISIVATLFCVFIAWSANTMIQMKVNVAVIQTELEYLEKEVEDLDVDAIDKNVIDLQIEAIRNELSTSINIKTNEIQTQINLIEQQIKHLEGDGGSYGNNS